jgi:hypothetical protein
MLNLYITNPSYIKFPSYLYMDGEFDKKKVKLTFSNKKPKKVLFRRKMLKK